jgi:hypothetical protein
LSCTAMVLGVAINRDDSPSASTVRHEAASYAALALFVAPLLVFSAHHTVHALGIRACTQNLNRLGYGAAAAAPDTASGQ